MHNILDRLHAGIDKARTVLTAAATWIAVAAGVAGVAAAQITEQVGADHDIAQAAAGLVVFLTGLGQVIRRVTPVPAGKRGLSTPKA